MTEDELKKTLVEAIRAESETAQALALRAVIEAMAPGSDSPAAVLELVAEVRLLRKLLNAYPCCSVHDMDEGHTEDCPVGKALR